MVAPLTQVPRQESAVEHYDSILRFMVRSRSQSGVTHLVDLGANDCLGECNCRYFVTTCGPSIRRGKPKQCYHVLLARDKFCDWAIRQFQQADKNLPASQQT
jgi:hypothetical protein